MARIPTPASARLPLIAAVAALGTACDGQNLAQSWQLDRLRILAIQADPAEPRPGDTVDFQALYYVPDGDTIALSIWFACLPDAASSTGCEVDSSALDGLSEVDPETMTEEEQAELIQQLLDAGLIGAEPFLSPSWTAPEDALDGLTEDERLEGVTAFINVTALPQDAVSESDSELAFKRVPISEAVTPNDNPGISHFLVDGELVALDATIEVLWGQALNIEPVLTDGSIQTYTYRTGEGVDEERVEEPYATWYTEGGSFDQSFSLYPFLEVVWTPPLPQAVSGFAPYDSDEVADVHLIAVVRDRRGGMAWGALNVAVGSTTALAAAASQTGSTTPEAQ